MEASTTAADSAGTATEIVDYAEVVDDHDHDHDHGAAAEGTTGRDDATTAAAAAEEEKEEAAEEQEGHGGAVAAVDAAHTVRLDYLQRPLTVKALHQWLEEMLGHRVEVDRIWINSIKTHCYIDLATADQATRAVSLLEGRTFPSTNTHKLEANLTLVTAKQAPTSEEAKLKPGEWKAAAVTAAPAHRAVAVAVTAVAAAKSSTVESGSGAEPQARPSSKRTVLNIDPGASAMSIFKRATMSAVKSVNDASKSPSVKAAAAATAKVSKTESDGQQLQSQQSQQSQVGQKRARTDVSSYSGRAIPSESIVISRAIAMSTEPLPPTPLDSRFRRTLARPHLYWMPAPQPANEQQQQQEQLQQQQGKEPVLHVAETSEPMPIETN